MPKPFDDFIMVDWSANSSPKSGKDSIWLAHSSSPEHNEAVNYRTRYECFEALRGLLIDIKNSNRRVLCGFDFCFGLPAGAVAKLRRVTNDESSIPHWHWLWHYLDCRIEDDEKNRNNRLQVANELNRLLSGGKGPFWGCQKGHELEYLGTKKDTSITGSAEFPERRKTENGNMGFPVWQLAYAGAVGAQSLMGMAYMHRLRFGCDGDFGDSVRVFPFEDHDLAQIVLAESYYGRSDLDIDESIEPKDKGQVMATVEFCRERQDDGRLASELLSRPDDDEILLDEGWTFTEPKPDGMAVLRVKGVVNGVVKGRVGNSVRGAVKKEKSAKRLPSGSPRLSVSEIYVKSFSDIGLETGLLGDSLSDKISRRMVHACGDVGIVSDIVISGDFGASLSSLGSGSCMVLTDSALSASAIMKRYLPSSSILVCGLERVGMDVPVGSVIPTRSALAMESISGYLGGSIVLVGNAPTALERLVMGIRDEGWASPALIVGTPVGFVGAVESKELLCSWSGAPDYVTLRGRKGGSAIGAAALNAILLHAGGISESGYG